MGKKEQDCFTPKRLSIIKSTKKHHSASSTSLNPKRENEYYFLYKNKVGNWLLKSINLVAEVAELF